MNVGVGFNVRVGVKSSGAYVHVANPMNTAANYTILDSPLLNGKPGAKVFVTHVYNASGTTPTYLNHPIGVWYTGSNWSVFNQDRAAMPTTAAFNVIIE
jgi:hypothetical protein